MCCDEDEYEGKAVEVTCDCGRTVVATIRGDNCQQLVWNCPDCGYKADVNA